jgi:hypothetical protein
MNEASIKSRGRLLASLLAGSWRRTPSPFEHSAAELEEIAPLLLRSGAAALVWRRVCHSALRATPAAKELHRVYRLYTLQAALHQQTIEQSVALLRSFEIEPILIKGWAVARLYPEQGLRSYADVDLCVRREQFAEAENALKNLPDVKYKVDLHRGFAKFCGSDFEEVYARSHLVRIGEAEVRVPCAEDHLRILAIHMLREGAWRPLWLCDVAVAIESRPASFDWNHCLGENRRWSNWVTCALRLAEELLGAEISHTPAADKMKPLPRWLVPALLKEWGALEHSMAHRHRAPMASYWHYPSGVISGFRHRWPNPIEATVSIKGSFNRLPRLPFQIGSYVARGTKFATRLPKLLREPN